MPEAGAIFETLTHGQAAFPSGKDRMLSRLETRASLPGQTRWKGLNFYRAKDPGLTTKPFTCDVKNITHLIDFQGGGGTQILWIAQYLNFALNTGGNAVA